MNLSISSQFSFKIYVPSSGITGSQNNQVSLKLQNGLLPSPWETQCEIIKPIVLNQWQTITFDFATDPFINFNSGSPNPIDRSDFSRVLIQINGENNNSNVLAFIDDFSYVSAFSAFNNLVWSDEFNSNGAVDSSNWFHQTQLPNGSSWYNGELQHYTNNQSNSFVSNGVLNILAKKETFTDQGQTKQYTSARLNSKFAFKYGRVEVRAKLPTGAGTWPAIWMLGKSITEPGGYWYPTHGTTNWPACGEIDIMEHWGTNQNVVSSAVHFPVNGNLNVGQYITNAQYKAGISSDFHIYAVEWNEQKIVFSVDGINHLTYNPSVKNQYTWPFNNEQYILLNVAIEPSVSNGFVQSAMEVDYVRVYQNICNPTTSTSTVSACGSYTWNGNTYATSGTYTWTGKNVAGCDSTATLNLTVKSNPVIGISYLSKNILCSKIEIVKANNTSTLGGGVWTSNDTSIATISTNNGASGTATAIANGTVTFTYTKTAANGCSSSASTTLVVAAATVPNAISGNNSICKGATTVLSSTTTGGVWSSLNGYATVNNSGVVAAANTGAAVIKYTVINGNGCSASATKNITVNAIPNIPSINYAVGTINPQTGGGGAFCNNKNFTLVGTPSGGVWSSTGGFTINSTTGAASTTTVGAASVTYTVSNAGGCTNARTISSTIVGCAARGINTNNQFQIPNSFDLYPNPAHSIVNLQIETLVGSGTIVITDLYGKAVKIQSLSLGTNSIDVSRLSKGMYFISTITSEGKTTKKLVVE